jgi:hypothetical protein
MLGRNMHKLPASVLMTEQVVGTASAMNTMPWGIFEDSSTILNVGRR